MNANGYRLIGFAVWQGGKWYLRRRLPSARTVALSVAAAGGALSVAAAIARRASS
jgi:hypothetical protein